MPRYPVFVVGSPRSGTSILVDVLLSAQYSGFREGMFLSLAHTLETIIDRHFSTFSGGGNKAILIGNVDKEEFKNQIFSLFKEVTEKSNHSAPWFDKTGNPEMILAIPILRHLWPESIFVFARRRGLENIASRLKKFPDHSFEYHCRDWAKNMAAWRNIRANLPANAYTEVDQQDMIQRPDLVADQLGAFLGLPEEQHPALLQTMRSNRPQQTEAGSAARILSLAATGWNEKRTDIFLEHCGAEMEAYGYTMDERYSLFR